MKEKPYKGIVQPYQPYLFNILIYNVRHVYRFFDEQGDKGKLARWNKNVMDWAHIRAQHPQLQAA